MAAARRPGRPPSVIPMSTHTRLRIPAALGLFLAMAGAFPRHHVTANAQSANTQSTTAGPARPAGWDPASHGSSAKPDYGRVFSTDVVHELRVTIAATSFQAMQDDLREVLPFGRGVRGAGPARVDGPPEGVVPAPAPPPPALANVFAGARGRGNGAPNMTTRDPMYVPVTVHYNGRTWTRVGMRYKGNSSLAMASMTGGGKIPFRLDFDRYEDEHPEIRNQRFYGFGKLTFSSNFGDDAQLREAFATEVLRDRGVPAARAAFYRVVVDSGNGPEYWGLYTMIEDLADGAMLEAQFGSKDGNLYKPEGFGADWTKFDKVGFTKKTNEKQADYSDIESAIAALHAPKDDVRAWRAGLEARFDVDLFLRWLAVNSVLQNWDAYGAMAHNYYLYGDPAQKGRLRWIPWDNNFSLGAGPMMGAGRGGLRAGGPPPGFPPQGFPPPGFPPPGGDAPAAGPPPGAARAGAPPPGAPPGFPNVIFGRQDDVLHRQVGEGWPLISRLLADDVYAARYRELLQHATGGLFAEDAALRRLQQLHTMIAPAIVGERGERPTHTTVSSPEAFKAAIDGPNGLKATIAKRHEMVRTALGTATR